MPKTKLGQEVKNYGYKKIRPSPSNNCSLFLRNTETVVKISDTIKEQEKEKHETIDNITVSNTPFNCISVKNFITNPEFLTDLKGECCQLEFQQKNNDLYKFQQSPALTDKSGDCIGQLRRTLLQDMRPWIMQVLGVDLASDTLDLFCAKYCHTDTLLCHDDELEGRKVAFIMYLSDEDWGEKDGGLLELFDTDQLGNPGKVVKKFVPYYNSFAFFEVSPVSFHQVSEVLSETKTRMSLSGWFHGPSEPRPVRTAPTPSPYQPIIELDEETFYSWINSAYLNPETQSDIQTQFEESSEISLNQFLVPELYDKLSEALSSHTGWFDVGPPDRRCYQSIQGEPDNIIKSALQFFTSDAFFLLLSNLTGLKLHELAPEDSDPDIDTL